jgi:hypothetical protein
VYAAGKLNNSPDAVVTYGAPLTGNQVLLAVVLLRGSLQKAI